MTSARKGLVRVFAALSSVLGLMLLRLSFVPYFSLKSVADRLAPDGELESFSPHVAKVLRVPWGVAGVALLLAAGWSVLRPNAFLWLLSLSLRRCASWLRDFRQFVADLRLLSLSGTELASLAVICGLGLGARLMLVNRLIEYDEAYTVMAFAHSPFRILVSDYHVPNNHIFHTILVRIVVLLLGSQPWQIRLPDALDADVHPGCEQGPIHSVGVGAASGCGRDRSRSVDAATLFPYPPEYRRQVSLPLQRGSAQPESAVPARWPPGARKLSHSGMERPVAPSVAPRPPRGAS